MLKSHKQSIYYLILICKNEKLFFNPGFWYFKFLFIFENQIQIFILALLIMPYPVVHHHCINPRKILWEIHFAILFLDAYLFIFSGVTINYGAHTSIFFHTSASFSVSLNLIWQPGSLINMDGTISLNGPWDQIR